jgi:hypothetical protein
MVFPGLKKEELVKGMVKASRRWLLDHTPSTPLPHNNEDLPPLAGNLGSHSVQTIFPCGRLDHSRLNFQPFVAMAAINAL